MYAYNGNGFVLEVCLQHGSLMLYLKLSYHVIMPSVLIINLTALKSNEGRIDQDYRTTQQLT